MANEQQVNVERRLKKLQEIQGYTDEEMAIFRSNPEYVKILKNAPKFLTHRIIIEVIESHNCIAGHKAGDRIAVMTGNANLITEEMPKYVCAMALFAALPRVYGLWERFHEDLDPDRALYKISRCPDVGCRRGGWGEIVMKVYAEEVRKEQQVKLGIAKEQNR